MPIADPIQQTSPFSRFEPGGDPRRFRFALGRFATGVAVVTTRGGNRLHGLTVNSFSAVSLAPPLVLWSLRDSAPSHELFVRSGCFAVSVLGAHQRALAEKFA